MLLSTHLQAGASRLSLILCISAWVAAAPSTRNSCDQLIDARLQVLLPGSEAYVAREASYFAANAPLHPNCIVQPRSTGEVSRVVKILAKTEGPVALRSGGHTQWAGSNDVRNGVTIDLGLMTAVTYDAQSKLASIQPGPRWANVYEELLKLNVSVTGGREGNVGVGGYLTGGGNSYYTGRNGWGCDNVANFEVVLANGDVVNANARSHSDLWTALKGGSGNFGIVTRFDVYTFPAKDVWAGVRTAARDQGDELAQAMVDFTNNIEKNPDDSFILNINFDSNSSPDVLINSTIIDTTGVVNAPAFDKIRNIPVIAEDLKTQTIVNFTKNYVVPTDQHQVWISLTFKNNAKVINQVASFHDELVNDLKGALPAGEFTTQCIFQPIPTFFTEHSVQRGGNVLGLDRFKENSLLLLIAGATNSAEQDQIMRAKLTGFSATIQKFARSENLFVDWQYLNYVDGTQNPLKTYGQRNIDFIRKVAAKYDPSQVFQKKIVSGWKISKINA